MPEIRCPMCSKPNPEENEVCQFCQARLKPLIVGQSSPQASPETPDSGKDRSRQNEQPHPPPPTSSPTEDLSRLRSEYEELLPDLFPSEENELEAASELTSEPAYEEPDTSDEYLGRLGGSEEGSESPTGLPHEADAAADEAEPVPEWLARIRQKEGSQTPEDQPQQEDSSDWLTRLRQKEGDQEEPPAPGEDQPDMTAVEAGPVGLESPSFKQPLQDVEASPPADQHPPEAEREAILEEGSQSKPEWSTRSGREEVADSAIESAEPGEMPDWLAEARQEAPREEALAAGEPTPDWMADSSPSEDDETSQGPLASSPFKEDTAGEVEAEGTPSWLTDEMADNEEDESHEQGLSWLESEVDVNLDELDSGAFMAVEEEDEVELPGWLAEAVDPTKGASAQDEPYDPSWREGKQARGQAGSKTDGLNIEKDKSRGTPLDPPSKPFVEGTQTPPSQPEDITWDQLKGGSTPSSDMDVPSRPFVEPPPSKKEQPAEAEDGLGLPAWLDEIREPPPEPEAPPEETPALITGPERPRKLKSDDSGLNLNDLELPEWIGEIRDDAASGAERSPELAPATLPTWLEAMRPIETFRADQALVPEEDQSVESIGPLAGLRGVLAAEPIMAMPRTASVGGARLEVSELQYARAEMLAHMIQEEKQEQAKLKPERRRIPIERLLVTLALLTALFLSLPGSGGAASSQFLPPENQPQSLYNLYDMVANVPLDRPVLVVFDYSPAFAGELETYAAPILADIVSRDLKIVTVSTHPTGPPLAARLLQNVRGDRELQNTRDYMHFGYLSGGPTAVQLFAANPRHALLYGFQLPVGTQTTGIWSYPIVENVSRLSDFGMLVVITAGTDSARTWVEQAGPYLGDTPLALVLSAGVEPLLQPYAVGVEPQVDNILSGLQVAYVYEGYMGYEGTARTNWAAFGSMLTVVELILIAGAIYGLGRYILQAIGVVKE